MNKRGQESVPVLSAYGLVKTIIAVVLLLLVIGIVGYFTLVKNQTPVSQTQQIVFVSQEECEQKTGKSCDFQMCDYIPPGKTFEEVCGKDFKKGWAPVFSPAASANINSINNGQSYENSQIKSRALLLIFLPAEVFSEVRLM